MANTAFDVISVTLVADKTTNDTIAFTYPSGSTAGTYKFGNVHTVVFNGTTLTYPADFSASFGSTSVTITILASVTIPSGAVVYGQFNKGGSRHAAADVAAVANTVAANLQIVPVVLVNLGSPATASATKVCASQTPSGAGNLTLAGSASVITMDVPRNVTVVSTSDVSGKNFTFTGTDEHGVAMTETFAGPNNGTAVGKKAFKKITQVHIDAAAGGAVTCGSGNVLGLPIVLHDTGLVLVELYDGAKVTNGTFVAADASAPSATTGDVRGTYAPNTAPNGTHAYAALVAALDVNVGGAQA
jgi:hypothetical protein